MKERQEIFISHKAESIIQKSLTIKNDDKNVFYLYIAKVEGFLNNYGSSNSSVHPPPTLHPLFRPINLTLSLN